MSAAAASSGTEPTTVDVEDQASLRYWCDRFGVTVDQLQESVLAAGDDPQAVQEHLLQQGSSAGAG